MDSRSPPTVTALSDLWREFRSGNGDDRLRLAVATAGLWGAWGFLGFGVLKTPAVFFLTVVAPGTWLLGERFGTDMTVRGFFRWHVFNGAMLAAGFAAYQVTALILFH